MQAAMRSATRRRCSTSRKPARRRPTQQPAVDWAIISWTRQVTAGQWQHRIGHGGCGLSEIALIGDNNKIIHEISLLGCIRLLALHNAG